VPRVGARAQNPAHLEAAQDRQIEVEDDEIRHPLGDGFERGVARSDDVRLGFSPSLEGVLDQSGDVLFVFDDEYTVSGHEARSAYRPEVSLRCLSC